MADAQIDILKTSIDWAKAEIFSSSFFALMGLLFILTSIGFWQLGKTGTAKAFIIPLLVAGGLLVVLGVGLIISNQLRTPIWQAGMISVIAMMAVILLVDTNANTRMQDYKDRLVQAEQQ